MKIGIITFHGTWNCGAVLQCIAMKQKLEQMGHEVVVINYRPVYWKEKYKCFPNPIKQAIRADKNDHSRPLIKRTKIAIRSFFQTIYKYNPKGGRLVRKRKFEDFADENLNQTRLYRMVEELRENPPECDVYLAGSDQIWNPKLTNGEIDEAYFCSFGENSIKRIGYAISACQLDVQRYELELKKLMSGFDYIALRESEQKSNLERLYGRDIDISLDPTLLLNKADYAIYELDSIGCDVPYLLVYAFNEPTLNELLYSCVRFCKEKYGLKVIVLSGPGKWPFEVEFYYPREGGGPREFLSYIKNAEFVITNSFHATAFSIIYEKTFFTLTIPGRESRVVELLNGIGLGNRLIKSEKDYEIEREEIDYREVSRKLERLQSLSIDYLKRALM